MKTYVILLTALACLLFGQMLTAQPSVYTLPFENPIRIPARETRIDMEEISATYQTLESIYTTEVTGIGEETLEQTSKTHISDAKAMDAVRFLQFYVNEQLMDPSMPPQGVMEMSVVYFNEDTRWNPGSALGILTFGVALLLGVPHSTAVVDVEVEATFFDAEDRFLATHRGVGRGKRLLTLYNQGGTRKAHQKALRKAIANLNGKILMDPSVTGIHPQVETP